MLVYFHSKDALSRDFRVSFCHLSFPPGLLMNKQNGLCVCVCVCVKIRKKIRNFRGLCCIYALLHLRCSQIVMWTDCIGSVLLNSASIQLCPGSAGYSKTCTKSFVHVNNIP